MLEPVAFLMGFVLRLFQIAMQQSLVGVIKGSLRVVIAAA
jgi:hypothetical protein